MADWPALPSPVSNNAVASLGIGEKTYIFSFNGLGSGKTWSDVVSWAFQYEVGGDAWTALDDVPGGGRKACDRRGGRGRRGVYFRRLLSR